MSGKGIYFYATRTDMEAVMNEIESTASFLYTEKGQFSSPQREFDSALSLPGFGTLQHGHYALEPAYIVVPKEQSVEVRSVTQNDGYIRYAIDQLHNPHSILFQPSGVYRSNAIIMGSVTTASDDPASLKFYKLCSKTISGTFQKANTSYVGAEATAFAKQGCRLTNDINRPDSYDLKI